MKAANRYPSIVDGKPGAYGVTVPDFPGCYGAGETIEDAVADATSALSEFAALMVRDGEEIPEPRGSGEVLEMKGADEGAIGVIYIPLILDAGRTVRANLSIDAGLLRAIDTEAKRRGLTRSAFLAGAARDKLERTS